MTLYSCKCGKEEKEVAKAKIIFVDGKWVTDVKCGCGKYMDSEPVKKLNVVVVSIWIVNLKKECLVLNVQSPV